MAAASDKIFLLVSLSLPEEVTSKLDLTVDSHLGILCLRLRLCGNNLFLRPNSILLNYFFWSRDHAKNLPQQVLLSLTQFLSLLFQCPLIHLDNDKTPNAFIFSLHNSEKRGAFKSMVKNPERAIYNRK